MSTFYYGSVINPKSLTDYDALPRCLIGVDNTGNIACIIEDVADSMLQETLAQHGITDITSASVVVLKEGEFIMPGLIDTHTHAVQVPNLGIGGETELLTWLNEYTFPTESRFESLDYAKSAYPDIVRRIVNSGTTTCCYYGSLHLPATKELANVVHKAGQRAFVGKCNMDDRKKNPFYYVEEDAKTSMRDTIAIIDHIKSLSGSDEPLVHPILTPRFAMSCTVGLLEDVGEYAKKHHHLAIQTHISENRDEVKQTLEIFGGKSYADVYDRFGLLRHNTVLAHGVHLTEHEMKLIHKRKAGVSHCPTSNFYLSSGMARVGMLLDYGVKVGLGTDVGGGYNPSILAAVQHASTASKMLSIQGPTEEEKCKHGHHHHHCHHCREEAQGQGHGECECGGPHKHGDFTNKKLTIPTLLYLATLGGAHVCCLQDRVGSFEKGKAFDALLVSVRDETGNPAIWGVNGERDAHFVPVHEKPRDPLRDHLERFLFCGDDRNIRRVIVQGKVIGGSGN
ncbi:Metallo-dependent hydrolase [Hygrophoropsis aurantiaca]|uniref:Metallo-dependent hydrolase n=1 Tax=Hygrophoropsis aurantiaca TaxID=72124 RepID=A0ACB8A0E1_9AGAM|nr:Metallo-dependent hydrolase [Hygrophoropsis aurantiaca]